MDYAKLLAAAVEASELGGKVLREGFDKTKRITLKGFADPVTEFDKASEKAIVEYILRTYPESSILTEEELSRERDSELRWIVDPIDGTVNFTHRLPFTAVSVGVEYGGELVAGVIYNPVLEQMFTASKGGGAYCNGKPIRVSGIDDPGKSLVATGFPYKRDGRMEDLLKPLRTVVSEYEGFRRLGSAAMDLAYVAAGICEIFYEENLKPWDTAAGVVLVREAGGTVTDYAGKPYTLESKTILATNGVLHGGFIRVLEDVEPPK